MVTVNIVEADMPHVFTNSGGRYTKRRGALVACKLCHGLMLDYGGGEHAVTLHRDAESGVITKRNCVGEVVELVRDPLLENP